MSGGRLNGKVCIILGASGTGSMGEATARRFAAEGARVIVAARREDRVAALARDIEATPFQCDITSEADLAALADEAIAKFGRLDVAVNFAGSTSLQSILDVTQEELVRMSNLHFVGPTMFFKHMAQRMTNGGSLITTSSLTAVIAPVDHVAYAGAKAGTDQVVRIAAGELGPLGIRVNSIAPGFMRTEMTEDFFHVPGLEDAFIREIPLRRLGTVNDVAATALWLASDEARATTGQRIDVTSGQSLRRTPTMEELG